MTSERKFIEENVKRVLLKEYLRSKTERSGFGGLDIQRTPMGTRVTLIAERPGMVIGRKGETIKELTDYVQNEFKFDNPQIEVKEVQNPNLNPHIMAQKLANALERGWHFRRAGHSTVRRIMSSGAKGCQIIISGKLTGQRHRTEKFREGHIKYCGETKLQWMHQGYAVAKKKLGIIGVKVQIMDPKAKLPDEIELRELKDIAEIKTITTEGVIKSEIEVSESVKDVKDDIEPEPKGEPELEAEGAEAVGTKEEPVQVATKAVKKKLKKKELLETDEIGETEESEAPAEPEVPVKPIETKEQVEPSEPVELEKPDEPEGSIEVAEPKEDKETEEVEEIEQPEEAEQPKDPTEQEEQKKMTEIKEHSDNKTSPEQSSPEETNENDDINKDEKLEDTEEVSDETDD